MTKDLNCGHPDEWQFLCENYGSVIDALANAHRACFDLLVLAKPTGQEQTVIHMLAESCLKEFEEILLLAGNGYGAGATKLVRSFYERVVTLGYLAKHPKKVQQFIDYTDVHWHKLLIEAEKIHSEVGLTDEQIAIINTSFENSKGGFTEVICKEHNKTRLQMSWTKKPIPDQASEVSEQLRWLCFNAYLRPTFYMHSTFLGITWQTRKTENDKLKMLGPEVEREAAREALEYAHILLMHEIDVINNSFKLGQDERIKQIWEEWHESWQRVAKTDPASETAPESVP